MKKVNKLCIFLFCVISSISIKANVKKLVQQDSVQNISSEKIEKLETDILSEKEISKEKIDLILSFLEQNKDIPLEQILERLKDNKKSNKLKKWLIKTTIAPLATTSFLVLIAALLGKSTEEEIKRMREESLFEYLGILSLGLGAIIYLYILLDAIVMKVTKTEE